MAGQAELWHICVFIVAEGMEMGRRAGGCRGGRAVGLRWGQCVCVAVGLGLLMLERERRRDLQI